MKQMKKRIFALLAVLALAAALFTGCGGKDNSQPPAPDPAPSADEANTEKEPPVSDPAPPPEEEVQPEQTAPSGEEDASGEEDGANIEVPPDEPAPEPPAPEEQPVSAPAQPEPEPDPEPEPEPDARLADGVYTVNVTLEGGTGRATIESPATLRVENGRYWATIVWSSANFDYMKVDGQRYDQTNTEGNSTFEIPVAALDQILPVIADTIAMSEPHEVEYTMIFDSASIQQA